MTDHTMRSPVPTLSQPVNKVRIAVIGAGWWSQGWHLPHLSRNPDITIAAIVDSSDHPRSSLNPDLLSLENLSKEYDCPTFRSVNELLDRCPIDGAIVCTPHHTHFEIGKILLERHLHILMEKPMTTNVTQARILHDLAKESKACFLVNHSANFREQAKVAKELVLKNKIGRIRHVTANMASPLSYLFNNPDNKGWVLPGKGMLGNGFTWGQACHLVGWLLHVCGDEVVPEKAFCAMNYSESTGADISFSSTVNCQNGVNLSLSGTALLPGFEHTDTRVGKRISIQIYGDKGALVYTGDDQYSESGKLEWITPSQTESCCSELGFLFENTDQNGIGPESMLNFVEACKGKDHYVGADSWIGFKTIQIIEALYRSSSSGQLVKI